MDSIKQEIDDLASNFSIEKYFEIVNELNNIRNSQLDLAFSQYRNDYATLCDDDDMDFKTMCKFKLRLSKNYDTKCKIINSNYKELKLKVDSIEALRHAKMFVRIIRKRENVKSVSNFIRIDYTKVYTAKESSFKVFKKVFAKKKEKNLED